MTSLAPLAAKVAKAIATIASSPIAFTSFLKVMGNVMGWIAKHPKLVMAAVGLKMVSSLIPKPVYLVGKGGKMLSGLGKGIKGLFASKGSKALSSATAKGLSTKQIAAGFGGKAAKDQLAKKGGAAGLKTVAKKTGTKSVAKVGAKLGAKAIGKSVLKKIPGIGLLAGIGFGLQRAMKGDFAGAALELASGAVSLVPGAGTAASVAIDAGLAARDIKKVTSGTAADFISRPGQPIQKFRADDVVVGGTNIGGGSGNVEALLQKILLAIESGGDVYMDGNKVGKSLVLATSNMG